MAKFIKWIDAVPDQSVVEVAAHSLQTRFNPVLELLPLAAYLADRDVEFVHQLRVWTRRTSSALSLYVDLLPRRRAEWLERQMRRIRKASNDARDDDVFASRLAADAAAGDPAAARLLERVRAHRLAAQPPIRSICQKLTDTAKLRRRSTKLLERIRPRGDAADAPPVAWKTDALARLRPIAESFLTLAAGDLSEVKSLHKFRIAGKHLRYVLELLAGALPAELRSGAYPLIQQLQERLGVINDHAVAASCLQRWSDHSTDARELEYLTAGIAAEQTKLAACRAEFSTWWTAETIENLKSHFQLLWQR